MTRVTSFGERIAQCRMKLGLSQAELSEQLQISKSTLAMYETNKREPSLEMINRLSEKLGVSIDFLISGKEMDIQKLLSNQWGTVPHVKEITCDDPIISHENIETYFSTPSIWMNQSFQYLWYTPKPDDYIKPLTGKDSWILISLQSEIENGDLAAVCLNNDPAILRRVFFFQDTVTLVPLNPEKNTPPHSYNKEEIKIRGKVIALIESSFFN